MACKCTGWKPFMDDRPPNGPRLISRRQCGPLTPMGLRRFVGGVHRSASGYHPGLTILNPQGLVSTSHYGFQPLRSRYLAMRKVDEMLADECRSRGLGGRR